MNTPTLLKLLLSDHAYRTWGARIAAAVPSGGLVFVTAEEAIPADQLNARPPLSGTVWPVM